jgi:hypothetical protein
MEGEAGRSLPARRAEVKPVAPAGIDRGPGRAVQQWLQPQVLLQVTAGVAEPPMQPTVQAFCPQAMLVLPQLPAPAQPT